MSYMRVTMSTKGQLVIPAEIRKRSHLRPSDPLEIDDKNGVITIRKVQKPKVEYYKNKLGFLVARPLEPCAPITPEDVKRILADFP